MLSLKTKRDIDFYFVSFERQNHFLKEQDPLNSLNYIGGANAGHF